MVCNPFPSRLDKIKSAVQIYFGFTHFKHNLYIQHCCWLSVHNQPTNSFHGNSIFFRQFPSVVPFETEINPLNPNARGNGTCAAVYLAKMG
jgi:hypothetical protein